jgi:cell wall-associated NlpC family hydrolase
MPVERRLRRLFVVALAVPVIVAVYVAAISSRLWSAVRPSFAGLLGATVIGSVYVEAALRHAPAPVRVSPIRAAAVMSLALVLLSATLPAAPASAHSASEAVLETAMSYLGTPYRLGAEGPDKVDCSGLIYRVFVDAGEAPRIGDQRLRVIGYYKWFKSRGLALTSGGQRGDLVVYRGGPSWWHIGFYLGDGRVLSALTTGVAIHPIHGIYSEFVAFLRVDYSIGDSQEPPADEDGDEDGNDGRPAKPKPKPDEPAPDEVDEPAPEEPAPDAVDEPAIDVQRGFAIGTMNLRLAADPDARVVGWVSRGTTFTVLGSGSSPSGALWFNVKSRSGREGWVYSRWARMLED